MANSGSSTDDAMAFAQRLLTRAKNAEAVTSIARLLGITQCLKALSGLHEGEVRSWPPVWEKYGRGQRVQKRRVWNLARLMESYGRAFNLDAIYGYYLQLEVATPKKQRPKTEAKAWYSSPSVRWQAQGENL
jgi:hypothetical protein